MTEHATSKSMHRKEAGSIFGLFAAQTGGPARAGDHDGRVAVFLHLHHVHAEVPRAVGRHFSHESVSFIMTSALVCYMLAQPGFGLLSDRIGIKPQHAALLGVRRRPRGPDPLRDSVVHPESADGAFGLVVAGLLIASFDTPIAGLVKAEAVSRRKCVRSASDYPVRRSPTPNSAGPRICCAVAPVRTHRDVLLLLRRRHQRGWCCLASASRCRASTGTATSKAMARSRPGRDSGRPATSLSGNDGQVPQLAQIGISRFANRILGLPGSALSNTPQQCLQQTA